MSAVVVIGSGFGGSIAAQRFTAAGHHVTLLELGEDWREPAKARQSQDPAFLYRLLRDYPGDHLRTRPAVTVTQGMGVGGGSLVYSGIHLRAPAHALARWPAGYQRAELDPYYARVEQRLGVAALDDALAFERVQAFAEGARRAGLPAPVALPLAIEPSCTRCGWCVPLCSFGKKRTMAHTYLAAAARTGRLTIHAHRKAAFLARVGGRYRVWAWRTDGVARDYHLVRDGALEAYDADRVIVAGGAIESPVLLARSLTTELPAGARRLEVAQAAALGRGLEGTGDFVQGGFVPQRVDGFKGAVMMSGIDLGDVILEDLHSIPIAAALTLGARPAGASKAWGAAYKLGFRAAGRHLLAIAVVGAQGTSRTITVADDRGEARVTGTAYTPAPGALEAARAIITKLGGEPAQTLWETERRAFTVHPTGGCAMGEVVSPRDLEVEGAPGVHVIDGSVLPGNPLRNPAHTIAAVAERALDAILG